MMDAMNAPQLMAMLQQGGMPNQQFANAPAAGGQQRQAMALREAQAADLASKMGLSMMLADQQLGLPPGTMLKRTLMHAIQQIQGAQMVPDSALQVPGIAPPQMPPMQAQAPARPPMPARPPGR